MFLMDRTVQGLMYPCAPNDLLKTCSRKYWSLHVNVLTIRDSSPCQSFSTFLLKRLNVAFTFF